MTREGGLLPFSIADRFTAVYLENCILYCIQDVRICRATKQMRHDVPALSYDGVNVRKC